MLCPMLVESIFSELPPDHLVCLVPGNEETYEGRLDGIPEKYHKCVVDESFLTGEEPDTLHIFINQDYKPDEDPCYETDFFDIADFFE